MNRYKLLGVVAILSSILLSSCEKDAEIESEFYNFVSEININYESDTISMGDTLWVESTILGFLKDSALNTNVHFKNANINVNMLVRSWSIENQEKQSDKYSFAYETPIDYKTETNNASILGLYFISKEGYYQLKYGVIFSTPGIYSIDTDYLVMKSYFSDEINYYGGGMVEMEDLSGQYKAGYLKCNVAANNRNLDLYDSLTSEEKSLFEEVNASNEQKYFFINVNN